MRFLFVGNQWRVVYAGGAIMSCLALIVTDEGENRSGGVTHVLI